MPIPTVDAVITYKEKLLLMLRNNAPVQDTWWLPGGRVRRSESLEDAVLRQVREETGLEGRIRRRVGVINQVFPEVHTISVFFHVQVQEDHVTLNEEHRAYRWVVQLPKDSHSYVQTMVLETLGPRYIEKDVS